MGVAATIAAIQALNATVSGVKSAPTDRPVERFQASLPCILVRPGALQMTMSDRGGTVKVRAYEGVALVTPPNQGRGIAEGVNKVASLMDALADFWEAQIESRTPLSTGGSVTGYRDSGEPPGLIGYGADDFEGFTFTVEVWEG